MNPNPDEEHRSIFGFASGHRAPQVMRETHQHQEVELNLLSQGALTYLIGGEMVRLEAGRLALFWASAPHQVIAVEPASRFYWFTVPLAWVLQWRLPEDFMTVLLRGQLLLGSPDPDDARRCTRWHDDLASGRNERQKIAQLEIEARVRRIVLERTPGRRPPVHRAATGGALAVQKMAEVIARRYTEPLTVEEIVRPTGLHPNYAMRRFKAACGLSLVDYLVQMRLFHARRLLATTERKVLDIAFESGFGSPSRFYEAFSRAAGCTPQAWRAQKR